MTLVNEWAPADGFLWPPKAEHQHCCTYCGGLLEIPFIWWRSSRGVEDSDILLHLDCVPALASRLLRAAEVGVT